MTVDDYWADYVSEGKLGLYLGDMKLMAGMDFGLSHDNDVERLESILPTEQYSKMKNAFRQYCHRKRHNKTTLMLPAPVINKLNSLKELAKLDTYEQVLEYLMAKDESIDVAISEYHKANPVSSIGNLEMLNVICEAIPPYYRDVIVKSMIMAFYEGVDTGRKYDTTQRSLLPFMSKLEGFAIKYPTEEKINEDEPGS
tara:strand:+ start:3254 stop:3847 length:594 start_codon:yes stop_codon:yes gene_type:complete